MLGLGLPLGPTTALDGGTLRVNPFNGWRAFEVITQGDNPTGDGFNHSMPGTFDGAGAWMVDPATLRVLVNHETTDASVSEVDLDFVAFKTAIDNVIATGNTGGIRFVNSARQAYSRWSADGGLSFIATSSTANTSFGALCSAQAYAPNTFGPDRGFVDEIYINGEEWAGQNRLFALDSVNRDFYQLSGTAGSAPGGFGGIPFDAFENAALVDTGETEHIALLLSPDGGTQILHIYIGEKNKGPNGNASSSFLARNGLAYGSWYYLNGSYPSLGGTNSGTISTSTVGRFLSDKLEDVDTFPDDPTRVVLGDQTSGVFVFDFDLDFSSGSFNAANSGFTVTMISTTSGNNNSLDNPDNLDWTAATTLGGTSWPEGIVFVNEDNASGEIWRMAPDGTNKLRIGSTTVGSESTGIFDLSEMVGFLPGSILISNNQGSPASMTVLINPDATPSVPDPVISGTILEGATPLAGVLVAADGGGGSDTTNANGDYSITVPANWSGSVTPTLLDYAMSPSSRSYVDVTTDLPNQDYAASYDPDLTAPIPSPMSFSVPPTTLSFSSITMTATTASDPSTPVEYFFECTNDPNFSSGWQASPTYVATGLAAQTSYTFRVRARDGALNEGVASPTASATTDAVPPEVSTIGTWQDGPAPGYSHVAPAGENRVLLVLCHSEANAAPTDFAGVTYGGQALTQVVERLQNQNSNYSATAEIWMLDEAGIQAATSSTITVSTVGAAETLRVSSVFYAGVDPVDPVGAIATAGENANESQTLSVSFDGGELDPGDLVFANNTVRNDQNGNTSWTWQNGLSPLGSYNPSGAPYLTYSDAARIADSTQQTVTVDILNNGVGALAAMVLNHAPVALGACGDDALDAGEQCDDGNLVDGDCCSSSCEFESSETLCRPAAGVCDVAETCDGAGICAPDGFQSAVVTCRAAAGDCDVAETCSGTDPSCPADVLLDGVLCLDGNVCNGTEACMAGVCESVSSLDCDDRNPCTADACDEISGCSHTPIEGCANPVPSMTDAIRALLTLILVGASGLLLAPRRSREA